MLLGSDEQIIVRQQLTILAALGHASTDILASIIAFVETFASLRPRYLSNEYMSLLTTS
jgi:hypothetical protein